jgi:hypothetical protein
MKSLSLDCPRRLNRRHESSLLVGSSKDGSAQTKNKEQNTNTADCVKPSIAVDKSVDD